MLFRSPLNTKLPAFGCLLVSGLTTLGSEGGLRHWYGCIILLVINGDVLHDKSTVAFCVSYGIDMFGNLVGSVSLHFPSVELDLILGSIFNWILVGGANEVAICISCTTLKTRGFRVFKYIYYYEIRTKVI